MSEIATQCVHFARPGRADTVRTLDLVLVGLDLTGVSHSSGFRGPDTQELAYENRAAIAAAGCRGTL